MSTQHDEKNKEIAEEQYVSMTNNTKIVETEEKPETHNQSVSQSLTNVLNSELAESIPASTSKKTESKDGGSGGETDTVKSSSNELTVKPFKESDNLKRILFEVDDEIKPKKCKDHFQCIKGKNESSSPKPGSDEDKSGDFGPTNFESPESCQCHLCKVSPLKAVIPTTDACTGRITNGKNDNLSHYNAALLCVVPSEESSSASNQPNSPKSLQIVTSNSLAVEEQKSPPTRVLRSSNKSGSNSSSGPSRGTSPIVPDELLAQTTSLADVKVDVKPGNPLPSDTHSEHTGKVSEIVSGDNIHATTIAAAYTTTVSESTATAELSVIKLHPKLRKLKTCHTESQISVNSSVVNVTAVETNPTVDAGSGNPLPSDTRSEQTENVSAIVSGDDIHATTIAAAYTTTVSESTATAELSVIKLHPKRRKLKACHTESQISVNSSVVNVTAVEINPTVDAGSGNPLPSDTHSEQTENVSAIVSGDDIHATTIAAVSTTAKLSFMKLHPKRRKLRACRTESQISVNSSAFNVTAEETNPSGITGQPGSITNCYQMFLNIRKQIDKKRKNLFPVKPKPPSGFKDYLMNKCTYILAGNYKSSVENTQTPPPDNLHEQLKKLFVEQEKERQRLRVQHIVEREKMVLSVEQEILRVHGRAARALANQVLPFSACTILKDEEVYNIITPEQEQEKNSRSRCRYNGRIFLSWLRDVDDKWENIKESLLLRHHNEAESLHAVQKMDWGWKLKELHMCTYSSEPCVDKNHVPMVLVDDFNLLPT